MNPLERLMPQQRPTPQVSSGQAMAAVHRFSSIRSALSGVMADPKLGKENIRPKLLDAASKLLAGKVLTLPEVMNTVKDLPDDPVKQKQFVDRIYSVAGQATQAVLEHHRANPTQGEEWTPEDHEQQMSSLMGQYNGRS